VCELPDHLPAGPVLNEQRILPRDPGPAGHICHFDQQNGVAAREGGYPAVDDQFFVAQLGVWKAKLVRVAVARLVDPRQDVLEFRQLADQFEDCLPPGPALADAQQVLRRRIDTENPVRMIQQDDARGQAVQYVGRFPGQEVSVPRAGGARDTGCCV
jgi:hypothetical protein